MNNRRFVELVTQSAANYPDTTFSRKGTINTCVNPFSYHIVRSHPEVYGRMDGLYVDGMLMCKLVNLLWNRKIPRLSFDMAGMAVDLFDRLNKNDETIYFIGARQEFIEATMEQIQSTYPNMHIRGYRNGYFSSLNEREDTIKNILALAPDFVVVGMGSPLQERFAISLKDMGYAGIVFTCGGFLHQTAKGINYYPSWINRYNLRAFYRLSHEKGLWGRLYNVLIEFPILFIYDTIKTKLSRP